MARKGIDLIVGLFMLLGIIAAVFLALKVSGLTGYDPQGYYKVTAEFNNIGSLKQRAPVRIAGVRIGQVGQITLDPTSFRAKVVLLINQKDDQLPVDTSASILTEGLLGSNYIGLTPGFDTAVLKQGAQIQTTHSALVLENLIGQLLFSLKGDKKQ